LRKNTKKWWITQGVALSLKPNIPVLYEFEQISELSLPWANAFLLLDGIFDDL